MPDYQKMYYILCAAASTAIDLMKSTPACRMARITLPEALHEAEELYINEGKLITFPGKDENCKNS